MTIYVGFNDGSTLSMPGETIADATDAVRSACLKMDAAVNQVQSIHLPDARCTPEQLAAIQDSLYLEAWTIDVAFAIATLKQYADPANWSGVSNRHQVVQRRWRGGGEGVDLAQSALARLQRHNRYGSLPVQP